MSVTMFDKLLELIEFKLRRNYNRPAIPPACRLLLTLRLLASGDSLQSVAYNFRIGKSTACKIFNETCEIIWETLQPIYLPVPDEEC
ncbi:hypothetical protein MML48_2g00000587 [Holotrichia oblita]|uniref:Uncharacterized protein n=2 Tax=Holotrichia oblita TaxID=644536 RepID=A0ACB9TID7_HOLOL|nr:hypothetical protein MML48_2g00008646 [Holotrichia oblita]KAI4466559.1 hypothetical protein MML48_2g00000587 [Holotrichia oblita]